MLCDDVAFIERVAQIISIIIYINFHEILFYKVSFVFSQILCRLFINKNPTWEEILALFYLK